MDWIQPAEGFFQAHGVSFGPAQVRVQLGSWYIQPILLPLDTQ